MPRAEKGTPKDIANRMKAKGLQKLKFYCQMCNKQCRDENGFKCHMTSDSHLRQMSLFSENAGRIMDSFSREFEKVYLDALRRRHGTKKMNANNVYQEVIRDKSHVHMNSTRWASLAGFVRYLGKTGKCTVEETERGWYVSYIERDPLLLARREAVERRAAAESLEEKREGERMERQRIEEAKRLDGGRGGCEVSNLERGEEGRVVTLTLGKKKKGRGVSGAGGGEGLKSVFDVGDDEKDEESVLKEDTASKKKKRERDEMTGDDKDSDIQSKSVKKKQKKKTKEKSYRKKYWLHENILVKIISKQIGPSYYKRKAIVTKLIDKYTAEIEILDSGPDACDGGDLIKIDQDDLETVIPKIGKNVLIVNGASRGKIAVLMALDERRYCGDLKLVEGGDVIEGVDYEDFSKYMI